jgi:hypothetical protein
VARPLWGAGLPPTTAAGRGPALAETGIRAEGACLPASVGSILDPEALGREMAQRLTAAGGAELLRQAEEMASR